MKKTIIVLVFLFSCAGTQETIFTISDNVTSKSTKTNTDTQKIELKKNSKIAVISGTSNDFDTKLAQLITDELKLKTGYTIIDQNEISRILPNYPYVIKDFGKLNKENGNSTWLSEETQSRINKIQNEIKADYILFTWSTFLISGRCLASYDITAFSRFIRYPESDVMGYSYFSCSEFKLFRKEKTVVDSILKNISGLITSKFAEQFALKKSGIDQNNNIKN